MLRERKLRKEILTEALERVSAPDSKAELVLIDGPSGTGKTLLVEETVRQCQTNGSNVLFISGKLDQYQSSGDPYLTVASALSALCETIVANDELLAAVRQNFQEKLRDEESRDLSALIPGLSSVAGVTVQPNTQDRQQQSHCVVAGSQRILYMFQLLIQCLGQPRHPLVSFLDDVQWMDASSKELVNFLADNIDSQRSFLLIAAQRASNNDSEQKEQALGLASFSATKINLGSLDLEDVNKLVSELLERGTKGTAPLAKLVFQRTLGNPYFCVQFLELLERQELLYFSLSATQWDWVELKKIAAETTVSENVVSLLESQIKNLPDEVIQVLTFAACLGYLFNTTLLESLLVFEGRIRSNVDVNKGEKDMTWDGDNTEGNHPIPKNELCGILETAVNAGLIMAYTDRQYKFSHNRMQQALYSMVPEREMLHLRIGRLIASTLAIDKEKNLVFLAADQLNRASAHHFESAEERQELIRINYQAAALAISKSSFVPSAEFLQRGIQLVQDSDWKDNCEFTLELFSLSAEIAFACGHFEEMDYSVGEIRSHGRCRDDTLRAHLVELEGFHVKRDDQTAIKNGIKVLNNLGQKIPTRPTSIHLAVNLIRAQKAVKDKDEDFFLSLPPANESSSRYWHLTKLLTNLASSCYVTGQNRLMVICLLRLIQVVVASRRLYDETPFALACLWLNHCKF